MQSVTYCWSDEDGEHAFNLVGVPGTHGEPYVFGDPPGYILVELPDFFIATVTVTQRLCTHLLGADANPAVNRGPDLPLENVSWDALTQSGGLLQQLNECAMAAAARAQLTGTYTFRLPSETEWEYAARGGPHWSDGFRFSGSHDVGAVAWYDRRHGDHTQPVARKAPNQLGIYDMSGNVWEWCEDAFTGDVEAIPRDGRPFKGRSEDRVLRGGCFHNWAMHCTVSKRYELAREFHDGCIGVRLVLADGQPQRG